MLGGELKQLLRKISLAAAGLVTGAGLALVLAQYPGVLEFRMSTEESYIKMDGNPICKPGSGAVEESK